MMAEPVRVGAADRRRPARRRRRVSLAFLARLGDGRRAARPPARAPRVAGCRDLTAADMVRNDRTGTVAVDAAAATVTPRRRADHVRAGRRGALLRPLSAVRVSSRGGAGALDSRRNATRKEVHMKRAALTLTLAVAAMAVMAAPALAKTHNVWPGHSIQRGGEPRQARRHGARPPRHVSPDRGDHEEPHQPGRTRRDAAPARQPDRPVRPGERADGERHLRVRQVRRAGQPGHDRAGARQQHLRVPGGALQRRGDLPLQRRRHDASPATWPPGTATTASSGSCSTAAATCGTSRTTTPPPASTWATRPRGLRDRAQHLVQQRVRDLRAPLRPRRRARNQVWGNCIGVFFLDDGQPGGEHNLTLSHNRSWANDKACAASDDGPAVSGIGVLFLGAQHSRRTRT